MHDYQALDNI